jgi:hypothetical protein
MTVTNLNLNTRDNYLTPEEVKSILQANPVVIERVDLEVVLQNCRKGARPVTIVADTVPSGMKVKDKDGNPLPNEFRTGAGKSAVWHVRKRAVVNGFVQYDYEAAMNRALVAEGKAPNFQVSERQWGDRREVEDKPRCCLVDHTPKSGEHAGEATAYMSLFVRKSLGYHYHLDDGVTYVDPALVHQFMGERKPEVITVRDYTLANIERVAIDGLVYLVKGTPAHAEWERAQRQAA